MCVDVNSYFGTFTTRKLYGYFDFMVLLSSMFHDGLTYVTKLAEFFRV